MSQVCLGVLRLLMSEVMYWCSRWRERNTDKVVLSADLSWSFARSWTRVRRGSNRYRREWSWIQLIRWISVVSPAFVVTRKTCCRYVVNAFWCGHHNSTIRRRNITLIAVVLVLVGYDLSAKYLRQQDMHRHFRSARNTALHSPANRRSSTPTSRIQ